MSAVRGLPERLPAGETLLWQGSPDWRTLARHAFHVRAIAAYFALILVWCAADAVHAGTPASALAVATLHKAGLALIPVALILLYAWGIQRSTTYSITNRRVVLSFGIALPMSFNLPFSVIDDAGVQAHGNGAGNITLRLLPGEKLSYFVMWPHARPWRMARTEPMLRGIPAVATVAGLLGQALADHAAASPAAPPVRRAVRLGVPTGFAGRAVAAE